VLETIYSRRAAIFFVCHVCFWHKADMLYVLTNVRFWGQSGHGPTATSQTRFMSTRRSDRIDGQGMTLKLGPKLGRDVLSDG
jgi:hypothetical protein